MKKPIYSRPAFPDYLCYLVPLLISFYLFFVKFEVTGDDVFIYFRVAKNFLLGGAMVINPGDTHFPVTSPAWTVLLILLAKVFNTLNFPLLAKWLYLICLSFASFFLYVLAFRVLGRYALVGILAIFFNPISTSTAGGEIALVFLALFGSIWAYSILKNYWLAGFFIGIGYLARAELIFLHLVFSLHLFFIYNKNGLPVTQGLKPLAKLFLGSMITILPWHIYYLSVFKTVFPTSLSAKVAQGASGHWKLYPQYAFREFADFFRYKPLLWVSTLFGIIYLGELGFFLVAFTALHFIFYSYIQVPNYHWYYYDLNLVLHLYALYGFIFIFFVSKEKLRKMTKFHLFGLRISSIIGTLVFLLVFICVLNYSGFFSILKIPDEKKRSERYESYVGICDYLNPVIRNDEIILLHEIGIVGYCLENGIVKDVNGLATPDVTKEQINDVPFFIRKFKPEFFVPTSDSYGKSFFIDTEKTVFRYSKVFTSRPSAKIYKGNVYQLEVIRLK